jgi:ribosomal protein S18 acetylase RimI-like enzyme
MTNETVSVEITQASADRLPELASTFGRAFIDEPMMRWPLGEHGDCADRYTHHFAIFLEGMFEAGTVWEAEHGLAAAVWISPDSAESWRQSQMEEERTYALTDDGGRRYDRFWGWVDSRLPDERLWHLDSIAVEPAARGQGLGASLIVFGLNRARRGQESAVLETGNPGNVAYYERRGFHVVECLDAPDGGPPIWFMRWDPDPSSTSIG